MYIFSKDCLSNFSVLPFSAFHLSLLFPLHSSLPICTKHKRKTLSSDFSNSFGRYYSCLTLLAHRSYNIIRTSTSPSSECSHVQNLLNMPGGFSTTFVSSSTVESTAFVAYNWDLVAGNLVAETLASAGTSLTESSSIQR